MYLTTFIYLVMYLHIYIYAYKYIHDLNFGPQYAGQGKPRAHDAEDVQRDTSSNDGACPRASGLESG